MRRYLSLAFIGLYSFSAFAASGSSLPNMLTSLVSAFVGKILPVVAFGYLGKNIFGHIQNDPIAKSETPRVVIATVCLLGIDAVWAFIREQVR